MKKPKKALRLVLDWLGSFGLCTSLLIGLFVLTLLGTLESAKSGLFAAQKMYFESFYLVAKVGPLAVPLPGAVSLMILLSINLFVGGFVRIRKVRRTVGVLIIHAGIGILLLAGLVKMWGASEGHVTLYEGQSASSFVSYNHWEVVVRDVHGAREWFAGDGVVRGLRGRDLRILSGEELPFEVHLRHFVINATVLPKGPQWQSEYPTVDGYAVMERRPLDEAAQNRAAIFATIVAKKAPEGTQGQQAILWSGERAPYVIQWEGKPYAIRLRRERYPMPFEIEQVKFTMELHPRTHIASVYSSDILRMAGEHSTPVHISMNEPMREDGLVVFQSGWGPPNAEPNTPLYSTFSVVRNPSDKWPEIACWVIAFGMLLVFGQRLVGYLKKQAQRRRKLTEGV